LFFHYLFLLTAGGSVVVVNKPKSLHHIECENEYAALAARTAAAQNTGKVRYNKPKNFSLKPATFVFGKAAAEPIVNAEPQRDVIDSMLDEMKATKQQPVQSDPPLVSESEETGRSKKSVGVNRKQSVVSNSFACLESNEDEFISFAAPTFKLPTSFNSGNLVQPTKSPYEAFHAKFKVGGNKVSTTVVRDRVLSDDEESL
jgi:hypothetical protein